MPSSPDTLWVWLYDLVYSLSIYAFGSPRFSLIVEVLTNWAKFHGTLFHFIHRVKQCTICQLTNYHYTIHFSRYLSQLELLQSYDINTRDQYILKYCKTFNSPIYSFLSTINKYICSSSWEFWNTEKDEMFWCLLKPFLAWSCRDAIKGNYSA